MIKIFGKKRYHWQPELSWSIIYWSVTMTLVLLGLSLLYERANISIVILLMLLLFTVLFGVGLHRYFLLEESHIKVASANPFSRLSIPIAHLEKVEVDYVSIRLFWGEFPRGKTFYMRKWPKKYFVNDLARHPQFQGEVELTDHLIRLDYFETYYAQK